MKQTHDVRWATGYVRDNGQPSRVYYAVRPCKACGRDFVYSFGPSTRYPHVRCASCRAARQRGLALADGGPGAGEGHP